jgi:hypothetical protein
MSDRFITGVLTDRTGRADGDTSVPVIGVTDTETGNVYAFPIFVGETAAAILNGVAENGTLAEDPIYFPSGAPDGRDWMPEQEPYTVVSLSDWQTSWV